MTHLTPVIDQANSLARDTQEALRPSFDGLSRYTISPEQNADLTGRVHALAERIREAGALDADRAEALKILDRAIPNTAHLDGRICFNLLNPFNPPSPPCRAYGETASYMQIPFVDNYGYGGAPRNIIRLDPRLHAEAIPQIVRDQVGFDPANTDLFFLLEGSVEPDLISGEHGGHHFARESRELLVKFHHVIFRDDPKWCDKKAFVPMGAFPLYGARGAQFWPIPINKLEHMEIYAHPGGNMMLYSPDGAHLEVDIDIPYSVFWIAAQYGGRACIAKVVCRNPLRGTSAAIERLFDAKNHCRNLADFKCQLLAVEPQLREELNRQFDPLARALTSGTAPDIERAFAALPRTYQENIYKQIWILKGCPRDVHPDFGRASFENEVSLAAHYHASNADKLRAVAQIQEDIIHELIQSQISMLSPFSARRIEPTREAEALAPRLPSAALETDRTAARVDALRLSEGRGGGAAPPSAILAHSPEALARTVDKSAITPSSAVAVRELRFEMKTVYLIHSPGLGRRIELRGGFPEGSGESLRINRRELTWAQGINMECIGDDEGVALWQTPVEIPSIPRFSFKFVVVDSDGRELYWLPEENIPITKYEQSFLRF